MVMEATHSAQSVGREFVRQYYTLLNKAPAHLHRFYNHDSTFIRGGLSNNDHDVIPVVGQIEIHKKIQQLNFRDCHTKISQVDCQGTLGDGVVVQVTGEISNGGEPMRRFTQTFVLAAQAPKKYYVHNDIFRYQDLGFQDDEEDELEADAGQVTEGEVEEGPSEAEEGDQGHQTRVQEQQGHPGYMATQQANIQQPQQQIYYPASSQQVHPMQPVINGSVHEVTPLVNQQPPQQLLPQQTVPPQQYIEPVAQEQFNQEPEAVVEQQQAGEEETGGQTEESHEPQPSETFQQPPNEPEVEHNVTANVNNRPKSYARTLRSSTMGSSNQVHKPSVSPTPMTNMRNDDRPPMDTWTSKPTPVSSNVMSQSSQHRMSSNQVSDQQQTTQQRMSRLQMSIKDNRGRREWPDHHQLFVGNVPHQASESLLREIFEKFGKVVDLRIFSKTNDRGKGPQGQNNSTRVPHYGFVTFDDSTVVTKVLSACPIGYPDDSGQKLNIEEKKNKPRAPGDGNMRSNQNDGNMRSMGQQQQNLQQRGPGGPGVMRGGQHSRGGRGFSRSDGGRGGMRQPGNMSNPGYQNRR